MRKLLIAVFSFFVVLNVLPEKSEAKRNKDTICLGWTGGTAGKGVFWSTGKISKMGNRIVITYSNKKGVSGRMVGTVAKDGTLNGTWSQRGSNGGFSFKLPDGNQARGYWWSGNQRSRKNKMLIMEGACR